MTGGTIEDNTIGINLNKKGSNTARALVRDGVVANNVSDYTIETTTTGCTNGSYMYFSAGKLATAPRIDMETNRKSILPTAENSELYLGNATASGNTAINNPAVVDGTVLATWFANAPEKTLHVQVKVADTSPEMTDKKYYVVSYPVDASGTVNGDALIQPVTKLGETDGIASFDVSAISGSDQGRVYGLFAANNYYTVSFDSQGGTNVLSQSVKGGETATAPQSPTRPLHGFEGWYTDPDCTDGNEYDFENTPITEDITLYAKWVKNDFSTTVDLSAVTITKNVSTSVDIPTDMTFTFKTEAYAVQPDNGTLELTDAPELGNLTVTVLAGQTGATVSLPDAVEFPIGGVYTYKITEIDSGADNWTYDTAEYYLDLEIEEDDSGALQLICSLAINRTDAPEQGSRVLVMRTCAVGETNGRRLLAAWILPDCAVLPKEEEPEAEETQETPAVTVSPAEKAEREPEPEIPPQYFLYFYLACAVVLLLTVLFGILRIRERKENGDRERHP